MVWKYYFEPNFITSLKLCEFIETQMKFIMESNKLYSHDFYLNSPSYLINSLIYLVGIKKFRNLNLIFSTLCASKIYKYLSFIIIYMMLNVNKL